MRRWGGCVNLRVETHHSCTLITAVTEPLRKCWGLRWLGDGVAAVQIRLLEMGLLCV
jgi:hypothetical protein